MLLERLNYYRDTRIKCNFFSFSDQFATSLVDEKELGLLSMMMRRLAAMKTNELNLRTD